MIKEKAEKLYKVLKEGAKVNFQKDGFIVPYVFLVSEDGCCMVVDITTKSTTPEEKEKIARAVKEAVRKLGVPIVGLVSEARIWTLPTGDGSVEFTEDAVIVTVSYKEGGIVKHKNLMMKVDKARREILSEKEFETDKSEGLMVFLEGNNIDA